MVTRRRVKRAIVMLAALALCSPVLAAVEIDADSNGAVDISKGGTNSITAANARASLGVNAAQPSTLNLTTDTSITSDQLIANQFVANQGAAGEVDVNLPAVSYSISRTIIVEEAQIVELNPPSGEAFDLSGTTLTADYCIDSPATVGSKAVVTRMQNASGVWFWSVDIVRGSWVDTGVSD